jgi:hypothetical protein
MGESEGPISSRTGMSSILHPSLTPTPNHSPSGHVMRDQADLPMHIALDQRYDCRWREEEEKGAGILPQDIAKSLCVSFASLWPLRHLMLISFPSQL